MPRKTENWIAKKLPEIRKFSVALAKFTEREIPIVGCAYLDAILADLIASSLRDDEKEVEEFVGLNGDGRAPLGSFGSRIQAAYMLRLIEKPQRDTLRLLKDIRNLFSHYVAITFDDPRVVMKVKRLYEIYRDTPPARRPNRVYSSTEEFSKAMESHGFSRAACSGIYVGVVAVELKRIRAACRRRLARRIKTA